MGERMVLDVAGAVAQRLEFRQRAAAAARLSMKPLRDIAASPSAAAGRASARGGVLLEGGGGDLHASASLGRPPIGGPSVMPASTSATWRTSMPRALALQLAGHVHQAAEVAGQQHVGAGRLDVAGLLARRSRWRCPDT